MNTTANTAVSSTAADTGNLQLEYVSSHGVASQPASWWQSVLGVVGFEKPPSIARTRIPVTASMTRSLNANDRCEVWRGLGTPTYLSQGGAGANPPPHSTFLESY